ncbi:Uncharacterised protein [Mycobacteroides abscessus subsp. abscessus]|nr:Uncharacterised protein [Mycobacteroides abscessus subsp. abscessus]
MVFAYLSIAGATARRAATSMSLSSGSSETTVSVAPLASAIASNPARSRAASAAGLSDWTRRRAPASAGRPKSP